MQKILWNFNYNNADLVLLKPVSSKSNFVRSYGEVALVFRSNFIAWKHRRLSFSWNIHHMGHQPNWPPILSCESKCSSRKGRLNFVFLLGGSKATILQIKHFWSKGVVRSRLDSYFYCKMAILQWIAEGKLYLICHNHKRIFLIALLFLDFQEFNILWKVVWKNESFDKFTINSKLRGLYSSQRPLNWIKLHWISRDVLPMAPFFSLTRIVLRKPLFGAGQKVTRFYRFTKKVVASKIIL